MKTLLLAVVLGGVAVSAQKTDPLEGLWQGYDENGAMSSGNWSSQPKRFQRKSSRGAPRLACDPPAKSSCILQSRTSLY
ncbi:MAG: hypothetical protein M3Y07_08765 [Acidobacteriota bacterium]|nr:hypothetical protein [Acidobacteriota bacterium]